MIPFRKSSTFWYSHAIYTTFLDTNENETAGYRNDFTRGRGARAAFSDALCFRANSKEKDHPRPSVPCLNRLRTKVSHTIPPEYQHQQNIRDIDAKSPVLPLLPTNHRLTEQIHRLQRQEEKKEAVCFSTTCTCRHAYPVVVPPGSPKKSHNIYTPSSSVSIRNIKTAIISFRPLK